MLLKEEWKNKSIESLNKVKILKSTVISVMICASGKMAVDNNRDNYAQSSYWLQPEQ